MPLLLLLLGCPSPAPGTDTVDTDTSPGGDTDAQGDTADTDTGGDTDGDTDTGGDTGDEVQWPPCEPHTVERAVDAGELRVVPAEGDLVVGGDVAAREVGGAVELLVTWGGDSGAYVARIPGDSVGDVSPGAYPLFAPTSGQGSFGWRIVVGQLDGQGDADVAISSPDMDSEAYDAGAVWVWTDGAEAPVLLGSRAIEGHLGEELAVGLGFHGEGEGTLAASYEDTGEVDRYLGVYVRSTAALADGRFEDGATVIGVPTSDENDDPSLAFLDRDGDGAEELVLGANWDTSDGPGVGRVWLLGEGDTPSESGARFAWAERRGAYGGVVWAPGDLDGDGHADLAVSATAVEDPDGAGDGAVFVHLGPFAGELDPTTAPLQLRSSTADLVFGAEAGPVGDLDGDGAADLAVAATLAITEAEPDSALYVFTCARGGVVYELDADLRIDAGTRGFWFGEAQSPVPDVDGDGLPELLLGDLERNDFTGGAWLHRSTGLWVP